MLLNLVKDCLTLLSILRTLRYKVKCCLWFETIWAQVCLTHTQFICVRIQLRVADSNRGQQSICIFVPNIVVFSFAWFHIFS